MVDNENLVMGDLVAQLDIEDLAGQFYHHGRFPNPVFADLNERAREWYIEAIKATAVAILSSPVIRAALRTEAKTLPADDVVEAARAILEDHYDSRLSRPGQISLHQHAAVKVAALSQPAKLPDDVREVLERHREFVEYHRHQAQTYIALGDAIKPEQRTSLSYYVTKMSEGMETLCDTLLKGDAA